MSDNQLIRDVEDLENRVQNLEVDAFPIPMTWNGPEWNPDRTYDPNDTARQGRFAAVANKITTDPIEPTPIGDSGNLLPNLPPWTITGIVNVVTSGLQLTAITSLFQIGSIRVWIQDTSGSTFYRTLIRNLTTATDTIGIEFSGSVAPSIGWLAVPNNGPAFLVPGNEYQFLLISEQHSATTSIVGDWTNTQSNQGVIPPAGECHRQLNRQTIIFNYFDDVGADREAALKTVLPETIITSTNGAEYNVIEFIDDPANNNIIYEIEGTDPTPGLQTWTFEIPTPDAVDVVSFPHWGTNPLTGALAQGVKREGTGATVISNDAYGFDLADIQEFKASQDWDILAISAGSVVVPSVASFDYWGNIPALAARWDFREVQSSTGNIANAGNTIAANPQLLINNNSVKIESFNNILPYADFDGVNQYFSVSPNPDLDITGAEDTTRGSWAGVPGLTFGGMFWADSIAGFPNLMGKSSGASNITSSYTLVILFNNIFVDFLSGSTSFSITGPNFSTGQWHFAVARFTPLVNRSLFFDRTQTDSDTPSTPASINITAVSFQIGARNASNFLNGRAGPCFVSANALSDEFIFGLRDQLMARFGV